MLSTTTYQDNSTRSTAAAGCGPVHDLAAQPIDPVSSSRHPIYSQRPVGMAAVAAGRPPRSARWFVPGAARGEKPQGRKCARRIAPFLRFP